VLLRGSVRRAELLQLGAGSWRERYAAWRHAGLQ